jgi:hypothetical protein
MDTIARMATYDEKKEQALEKARNFEATNGVIVPEPQSADEDAEEELPRKHKRANSDASSSNGKLHSEHEKPPSSHDPEKQSSDKGSSSSNKKKSSSTSENAQP